MNSPTVPDRSDPRPAPDASTPPRSEFMAPVDRPEIRAPLDGGTGATSRRAVVAAGLAVSAQATLGATSIFAIPPAAASRSFGLNTRLTREYGVRFPFVGAGMGFIATPALVAAVSNAGGIGVFGNGIEPPPSTQTLIQQIKLKTSRLFGVDFIYDDSAFGPLVTDAHINVCIAEQVRLVVFHMNVPPKPWVDRLHAAGARVWMQAGSIKQAVEAACVGVDAVVAQGAEAGGHNKSTTAGPALLAQIIQAVHPVMVLAAGGIADGLGVFKALSGGAEGVWVGTRLVASTEAAASAQYKARLVAAREGDTVTTTMFGPEYPNRPYRVLRNRVVNEFAGARRQDSQPTTTAGHHRKDTAVPAHVQAALRDAEVQRNRADNRHLRRLRGNGHARRRRCRADQDDHARRGDRRHDDARRSTFVRQRARRLTRRQGVMLTQDNQCRAPQVARWVSGPHMRLSNFTQCAAPFYASLGRVQRTSGSHAGPGPCDLFDSSCYRAHGPAPTLAVPNP